MNAIKKFFKNLKLFFKNYRGLLKTGWDEAGILGALMALLFGWFILLFFWGKEMK